MIFVVSQAFLCLHCRALLCVCLNAYVLVLVFDRGVLRWGSGIVVEVSSVKGLEVVEVGDVVLGLGEIRCAVNRVFDK